MSKHVNLKSVLVSKWFKGIGRILSNRLLDTFESDEFNDLLESEDVDGLCKVRGINANLAYILIRGSMVARPLLELAYYFDGQGFPDAIAEKAFSGFGVNALNKIRANPYRLLAIADWEKVDVIGLNTGDEFHPCRLVGAIEWCMYVDYEQNKNTCIDKQSLMMMVQELIHCSEFQFEEGLRYALNTNAIIKKLEFFQVPAAYIFERKIETFLAENWRTRLEEQNIDKYLFTGGYNELTPEQLKAVKNALLYRISAYHGGAGRGKTWTLKAIVAGAEFLLHKKIILTAVSAKACKRMTKETGRHSFTIAKLIKSIEQKYFDNSLIIIDEASMLSIIDAYHLFKKIPMNANMLLIGDYNQLPSFKAGRLFYDIIINKAVHCVELTINKRQDKKTDLLLNEIINGNLPVFDKYIRDCGSGIFSQSVKDIYEAEDKAVEIYSNLIKAGEVIQIISPLRNWNGGSLSINKKVQIYENGKSDFCVGTPVVWNKNKTVESREYMTNGSMGLISKIYGESRSIYHMQVNFDYEGLVDLTLEEVSQFLDMAYCLTTHKAQGSEWDNVIIVLPYNDKLIDRSMIYTALSRFRKRSIMITFDVKYIKTRLAAPPEHIRRRSLLFMEAA